MWWMKPIPPVSCRIHKKKMGKVTKKKSGMIVCLWEREMGPLLLPSHATVLTAIAMAIPASVTVSMGEETSGVFRVIFLVRAEVRS